MNQSSRYLIFIVLTPVFFIIAQWISVFPHEYAHSTVAWLFDFKQNPFAIHYGHFNWQNVIFVIGIDEYVNYYLIDLRGYRQLIGFIAIAGPVITLMIYLLSLFLLKWQPIKKYPYWFYFLCWVNLVNLTELVSYVLLRPFSTHGDIGHITSSWGLSPWWIFIVGGSLLIVALWYFFARTVIELYARMCLTAISMKVFILICFTLFAFGQGGVRIFLDPYGLFATRLGILSFLLIPIVMILCWPPPRKPDFF